MWKCIYLRGLGASRHSIVISRSRSDASDPIQKLFIDKIREYKQKSEGGKLVEASDEVERELTKEITKLEQQYGVSSGVDMTSFPCFKFEEPKLDPIDEVIAAPKDAKGAKKKGSKDDKKTQKESPKKGEPKK